ncbi:hypothetical protein [Pseudonocardia asaccharolytica]|uniref:Uncharacterized protein n=1 Tax=Pseudonocardia asaccharolytica DSM 44247 = NBRC 16224 TaxID=1123024 RepID=A0A511D2C4_9PSEU|nr:hypothetical protein [Pseudonocardia asaccharolytica]GEL18837.1 hypothetical protein PA7_26740 [Pseudonocardia asaccharolytica DSM 44247 = NBRC 16224]
MREAGQRDVVFTPFMLRTRDVLDGEDRSTPLRLRPSCLHPVARATDEWFYLRARSEQVIAEANAMLRGRAAPVDLLDEYGTGELGFVLRRGDRSARIRLGQAGRQAWVELQRPYVADARPVEPEDPAVLEDLVVELLADTRAHQEGRP